MCAMKQRSAVLISLEAGYRPPFDDATELISNEVSYNSTYETQRGPPTSHSFGGTPSRSLNPPQLVGKFVFRFHWPVSGGWGLLFSLELVATGRREVCLLRACCPTVVVQLSSGSPKHKSNVI